MLRFSIILSFVCLSLSAVDKFNDIYSKFPPDKILDLMIERERRKAFEDYTKITTEKTQQNNQPIATDKEAHFYKPKKLKEIKEEDKKVPIEQRIRKKYIGEIPSQMHDLLFYFSNPELCKKKNIKIHNRLLLHGNPGNGKSHLTKVIAEELGIAYLSFTASFFGDKYIGESSRKIRQAFEIAKTTNEPLLIFIDEIDAIGTRRKDNTHNEHRATLITLLTEMQELQNNPNVYIIAATNDLKSLDPAVQDRFGGAIAEIKDLTVDQRTELIKKLFQDRNVTLEHDFAKRIAIVLDRTEKDPEHNTEKPTFSNRDLENIATTSLLKQFADCHTDAKNCNKHLCRYIRKAIDSTGKKANCSWYHELYCDGI